MNEKNKNILSTLFRFGLSAILLIYLYYQIDIEKTMAVVKTANLGYIGFGFIIFVIINFVILFRWWIFIKALDLNVPFTKVMRYFFIGLFGNLFLPSSIGGDFIKIFGLCRDSSQKAKVVASVILDRLSGFASIVIIATISFIFAYRLINDLSLLFSILTMAFASSLIAVVLFNERVYSFGCKIFTPFPKLKQSLMNLHYDIALLKDRTSAIYQAIGMSCCSQSILAVTFYLIAKSLHQDVPLIYFLIFVPLICVASAAPSIGGLGVREAGAAYLFSKVGVDSGIAISISLVSFIYMVLLGLIGGIIFLSTKASAKGYSPAIKDKPAENTT